MWKLDDFTLYVDFWYAILAVYLTGNASMLLLMLLSTMSLTGSASMLLLLMLLSTMSLTGSASMLLLLMLLSTMSLTGIASMLLLLMLLSLLQTSCAYCLTVGEQYLYVGCAEGIVRIFNCRTLNYLSTLPRPHPLGVDVATAVDSRSVELLFY